MRSMRYTDEPGAEAVKQVIECCVKVVWAACRIGLAEARLYG